MTTERTPLDARVLSDLTNRMATYFGIQLKQEKCENFNLLSLKKELFRAQSYLNLNELVKAAVIMDDLVPEIISRIGTTPAKSLSTIAGRKRFQEGCILAQEAASICHGWKEVARGELKAELKSTGLFTDRELAKDINPFTDLHVDQLFESNFIRVYRHKEGAAPLPQDLRFKLSKEIVASPDLDSYMRATAYISAKEPGNTVFVPFFKIEQREDLSFWVFFIVYEDHVWVATDQEEFHNPHNKASTRRADRRRDERYEKMWLPDVLGMLKDNRSKSREIAAAGATEYLRVSMLKAIPEERFFLLKLAEHIVRKCMREELGIATTMGMHSERLMLTHQSTVPNAEDKLDGWIPDAQEHFKELLEVVPEEKSNALVPMDYSVVLRSQTYDKNWLGSPSQLDALAHWIVVDKRRSQIQGYFDKIEKREEKDFKALQKILDSNADFIIKTALMARKIDWIFTAVTDFVGVGGQEDMAPGDKFVDDFISEHEEFRVYGRFHVGLTEDVQIVNARRGGWRTPCKYCGKNVRRAIRTIEVRHWKQFCFLSGKSRKELPPYYQSYRAHNLVPYTGNSILDNTHPLALISDPCTEDNPNGLWINVYVCGNCRRKMMGEADILAWDGEKMVDLRMLKDIRKPRYGTQITVRRRRMSGDEDDD